MLLTHADLAKSNVKYLGSAGATDYSKDETKIYSTDGMSAGAPTQLDGTRITGSIAVGASFIVATNTSLWRFDGAVGTKIYTIADGPADAPNPREIIAGIFADGRAVFRTIDSLVVTDGHAAGTTEIPIGTRSFLAPLPHGGVLVSGENDQIFVLHTNGGNQLETIESAGGGWGTPIPTPNGALLVGDIPNHGRELLFSTGAPHSTKIVTENIPGPVGSSPREPLFFNGRVFYAAIDPSGDEELYSVALSP